MTVEARATVSALTQTADLVAAGPLFGSGPEADARRIICATGSFRPTQKITRVDDAVPLYAVLPARERRLLKIIDSLYLVSEWS